MKTSSVTFVYHLSANAEPMYEQLAAKRQKNQCNMGDPQIISPLCYVCLFIFLITEKGFLDHEGLTAVPFLSQPAPASPLSESENPPPGPLEVSQGIYIVPGLCVEDLSGLPGMWLACFWGPRQGGWEA